MVHTAALRARSYHHRIRNLSGPKRSNTFVQSSNALGSHDFADAVKSSACKRRHCRLHPHFHCLQRTQSNVGQELRRRRTSEVDPCLILDSILLTCKIRVELLEVLVPAVLERSLDRIAEECGRASGVETSSAFGADDGAPAFDVALVELRVDLATAFDEIQWCDTLSMSVIERLDHYTTLTQCVMPQAIKPPKVLLPRSTMDTDMHQYAWCLVLPSSIVLPTVQFNLSRLLLSEMTGFCNLFAGGITQLSSLVFGILGHVPGWVQVGNVFAW